MKKIVVKILIYLPTYFWFQFIIMDFTPPERVKKEEKFNFTDDP